MINKMTMQFIETQYENVYDGFKEDGMLQNITLRSEMLKKLDYSLMEKGIDACLINQK